MKEHFFVISPPYCSSPLAIPYMNGLKAVPLTPQREPKAWLVGLQAWLDGPDGGTDRLTSKRMNGQQIFPFYRTMPPIGTTALLPPMTTKKISFEKKVEKGIATDVHFMSLVNWFKC